MSQIMKVILEVDAVMQVKYLFTRNKEIDEKVVRIASLRYFEGSSNGTFWWAGYLELGKD